MPKSRYMNPTHRIQIIIHLFYNCLFKLGPLSQIQQGSGVEHSLGRKIMMSLKNLIDLVFAHFDLKPLTFKWKM